LVYFAAFKKHIVLSPVTGDAGLEKAIAPTQERKAI